MRARSVAACVAAAAALLAWRRRSPRESVELTLDDASIVPLEPGAADGARLLALAREVLESARSG